MTDRVSPAFRALLAEAVRRSGEPKHLFAASVGLSPSQLSRLLRTTGGPTPDCILCLRLAQVSGLSPFTVLHAAGYESVADVLRALFVQQPPPPLTAQERRLLTGVRSLTRRSRRVLQIVLDALVISDGQAGPVSDSPDDE